MGFQLPRVSSCCFCFSLRTGALIIGYLSMLGTIVGIASASFLAYMMAVVDEKYIKPYDEADDDDKGLGPGLVILSYIVCASQLLLFTVFFVFSLLLVIGTHKNKPKYMRYYYVAGLVFLGLSLLLVITGCATATTTKTISQLVSCALTFYFLLVIRSTYLEIEEQKAAAPPVDEKHF